MPPPLTNFVHELDTLVNFCSDFIIVIVLDIATLKQLHKRLKQILERLLVSLWNTWGTVDIQSIYTIGQYRRRNIQ